MKKYIIAGFAGIGKTTLGEIRPDNKIDTIILNKNENIEMKLKELNWLD